MMCRATAAEWERVGGRRWSWDKGRPTPTEGRDGWMDVKSAGWSCKAFFCRYVHTLVLAQLTVQQSGGKLSEDESLLRVNSYQHVGIILPLNDSIIYCFAAVYWHCLIAADGLTQSAQVPHRIM